MQLRAIERTALVEIAGSRCRVEKGGNAEGEWRSVRGWGLKVRGTGLIGLGYRRERERVREEGRRERERDEERERAGV